MRLLDPYKGTFGEVELDHYFTLLNDSTKLMKVSCDSYRLRGVETTLDRNTEVMIVPEPPVGHV